MLPELFFEWPFELGKDLSEFLLLKDKSFWCFRDSGELFSEAKERSLFEARSGLLPCLSCKTLFPSGVVLFDFDLKVGSFERDKEAFVGEFASSSPINFDVSLEKLKNSIQVNFLPPSIFSKNLKRLSIDILFALFSAITVLIPSSDTVQGV